MTILCSLFQGKGIYSEELNDKKQHPSHSGDLSHEILPVQLQT